MKFGTPVPIRVQDPRYAGVDIPVRAYGDYSIRVNDSQMLLNEFVGTQHLLTTSDFVKQFSTMVVQELNKNIKRFAREKNISTLDFPEYAPDMADFIKETLVGKFEQYGIEIVDFQFAHVGPNEDDHVVKELLDNRLASLKERERRDIQGFNYQQERQFDILETAAGNEGTLGAGMMGAGIGMGMGLGVGGMFGSQMQQVGKVMNDTQAAPPPPPTFTTPYYVYINGGQQGPFDINTLKTLVASKVLTPDTLVWKQGMAQWGKACEQTDLQQLFMSNTPPPPPPPVM